MLDHILDFPAFLGSLILMAVFVVAGLAVYFFSQRTLFRGKQETLGDATRTIFLSVNLLFGLFLSLTLNDVVGDLGEIQDAVNREAVAISDLHRGLSHFDSPNIGDIKSDLIEYTQLLIDEDWPSLAEDKLSKRADRLLQQFTSSVLLLDTDDRIEGRILERVVADMDSLSDYRLARLHHALAPPPFFLLVVLFGMFVVMICLGLYPPSKSLAILVSFYLSFVGLVVYLVLALSDPFQGIPGVDNTPLVYVLAEMNIDH